MSSIEYNIAESSIVCMRGTQRMRGTTATTSSVGMYRVDSVHNTGTLLNHLFTITIRHQPLRPLMRKIYFYLTSPAMKKNIYDIKYCFFVTGIRQRYMKKQQLVRKTGLLMPQRVNRERIPRGKVVPQRKER